MEAILTVVVVAVIFGLTGFLAGRAGGRKVAEATKEDLEEAAAFGSWLAHRGPARTKDAVREWLDPSMGGLRARQRRFVRDGFLWLRKMGREL